MEMARIAWLRNVELRRQHPRGFLCEGAIPCSFISSHGNTILWFFSSATHRYVRRYHASLENPRMAPTFWPAFATRVVGYRTAFVRGSILTSRFKIFEGFASPDLQPCIFCCEPMGSVASPPGFLFHRQNHGSAGHVAMREVQTFDDQCLGDFFFRALPDDRCNFSCACSLTFVWLVPLAFMKSIKRTCRNSTRNHSAFPKM